MEDVDFIEYDRKLIECAKNHRKEKTRAESLFWSIVRNRKI
jgi:very-short-patch-repair endonuclease